MLVDGLLRIAEELAVPALELLTPPFACPDGLYYEVVVGLYCLCLLAVGVVSGDSKHYGE